MGNCGSQCVQTTIYTWSDTWVKVTPFQGNFGPKFKKF
jgi:hypothetical protein